MTMKEAFNGFSEAIITRHGLETGDMETYLQKCKKHTANNNLSKVAFYIALFFSFEFNPVLDVDTMRKSKFSEYFNILKNNGYKIAVNEKKNRIRVFDPNGSYYQNGPEMLKAFEWDS